jgi:hypothetical protein
LKTEGQAHVCLFGRLGEMNVMERAKSS